MNDLPLDIQIKLKDLELRSLLEITQAINANLTEGELYRIYNFILRANLKIKKIVLFVHEVDGWLCKVNFGTTSNFLDFCIETKEDLISLKEINQESFDKQIPIIHNKKYLAYVFVSVKDVSSNLNTEFIQALTNIITVAIQNKKLVREQKKQILINKEMEIAEKVQQLLLPKELPYSQNLKVVAEYRPHHSIGGDYYDFVEVSEDHFFLCIADVSGKGVPAALLMSNFQALLRTLVKQSLDLKYIVSELNYQLKYSAFKDHFITFFISLYDKKSHKMTYVNAGHNPPVLFNERGEYFLLDKGSIVLGFFEELPSLEVGEFCHLPTFDLFCYTDGITELENKNQEEYGFDNFFNLINKLRKKDLKTINQNLFAEMDDFRQGVPFNDDVTLLSCRWR